MIPNLTMTEKVMIYLYEKREYRNNITEISKKLNICYTKMYKIKKYLVKSKLITETKIGRTQNMILTKTGEDITRKLIILKKEASK